MEGDLAAWASHMAIMWRRASPESGMFSDEGQRRFQSRPLLLYDIESANRPKSSYDFIEIIYSCNSIFLLL
jgi:hypothetical protein